MRCPRQQSSGGTARAERQGGRPGCCLRGRRGAAVPGVLPGSGRGASAPSRGGGGCGGDASRAAQPGPAGARRPARGDGASAGGGTRRAGLRRGARTGGQDGPPGARRQLSPAYLRARGSRSRRARSSPPHPRASPRSEVRAGERALAEGWEGTESPTGRLSRSSPHRWQHKTRPPTTTPPRRHPVLLLFRVGDAKCFTL